MSKVYSTGDQFESVQLEPGTKLYRLDTQACDIVEDEDGNLVRVPRYDSDGNPVYEGDFFATEEQVRDGGYITTDEEGKEHFDAEKFANDMQIAPYEEEGAAEYGQYKNHVSVFETQEPVAAKTGVTDANASYGSGGGKQTVISEEEQEKLKVLDEEYIVDHYDDVDKHAARDMLEHGREVSAVESGEIDESKRAKMETDADQMREDAKGKTEVGEINPYGLTEEELAENEEAEAYYLDVYQKNGETSDQYDDVDDWRS